MDVETVTKIIADLRFRAADKRKEAKMSLASPNAQRFVEASLAIDALAWSYVISSEVANAYEELAKQYEGFLKL